MVKKFAVVKVHKKQLKYGKKYGVSLREAENAFQKGFIEQARKKKNTKYKGYAGIQFDFY